MQVVVGIGVALLFLFAAALQEWSYKGPLYRRVRNRSARGRGDAEPFPGGRWPEAAIEAQTQRLRRWRPWLLPLLVIFAVVQAVLAMLPGHHDRGLTSAPQEVFSAVLFLALAAMIAVRTSVAQG